MAKNGPSYLVTVKEAAARLAVSERTVWTLIASGEFRRIKLGSRSTRVNAAEVEAFISRRTEDGESPR